MLTFLLASVGAFETSRCQHDEYETDETNSSIGMSGSFCPK